MSEFVFTLFVIVLIFLCVSSILNRIPKTGRCFDASGKEIDAVIINDNKTAEKAVTMRLQDENGRKYRVKLKDSEAKLWIKGDRVKIILSENSDNYRVLFHDYFKNNENRIREHALERLEKTVNPNLIAARIVEYKKETPEAFRASKVDSQTIFAFLTYMRMIDIYLIVTTVLAVAFLGWYIAFKPKFLQFLLPCIVFIVIFSILNGAINSCKRVLRQINK